MSIASLYPSINPSLLLDFANSKVLDSRVTFTRTTTATYYDGVTTAKAEENLLLQSQFASNWTTNAATSTLNSTTAPDGTTTATTLTVSTATSISGLYQNSGITSSGITLSIYAKVGTSNFVGVSPDSNGAAVYANFNLNTGAVASSAGCTASIVSVGSGWYRCILANTTVAGNGIVVIAPKNADPGGNPWGNGTPSVGNSVYIWGAQLEQRSSATAYTATTTQAITNYIPVLQTASAGQARFDHNPTTGESLGLLIEEARTNVATYSEDFGNAAWSKGGSVVAAPVVTTNQVIAPNGTLTGDQVDLPAVSGTNAFSLIYFPFTASALAYTGSFYLKGKNGGEQIWINFTKNGVNYTQTLCTLTTSWQRFSLSSTLTAGGDNFQIGVDLRDSAESAKSAQTFFIWGAQLEAGSFATSYIPTVASSVTRNADAASMTGTNFSSWFNYGAMTIYYEATGYYTASGAYEVFDLDSGSNNGRIRTRFLSSEQASQLDASSTPTFGLDGGTVTANSFAKVAVGLTQNSQALSLNGGAVVTATAPFTTLPVPTTARIGTNWVPSEFLNGTIKKIAFYPVKATNAQLQALTV